MRIRTKLFLVFSLVGMFWVIGGGFSFIYFTNNILKQIFLDNLQSIAQFKSNNIIDDLNKEKEKIQIVTSDHHYIDFLRGNNPEDISSVDTHLLDVLDTLRQDFEQVDVLDKSKKVVLSTNSSVIGTVYNFGSCEGSAETSICLSDVVFSDQKDKYYMTFYAPISDPNTNELVGFLLVKSSTLDINNILTDRTGLGNSGETYLVNSDGLMVTPSRFETDTVMKKVVDTANSTECFKSSVDNSPSSGQISESFLDYRGVQVVGAYSYIPSLSWCLLSEVDSSEAFKYTNLILEVSVFAGLVMLLIVFAVSTWLGLSIGRPIALLEKGVEIIRTGNFNYKVGTNRKDEIGALSRMFDELTQTIKESRKGVEKKVKDQTAEIMQRQVELREQQMALINILEDVEEEKDKTSLEKDKLDTILHSIGDGVFAVDNNYNIIIFNDVAGKISGYTTKEVLGKPYYDVLKFVSEKTGVSREKLIKKAMEEGEIQHISGDTVLVRKNGETVPVSDSIAPIKNKAGDVIGCIVVFKDATEERKIDKMKSEFVSVASHQLRTPLTGIQWVSERLNKTSQNFNEKEKSYVNDINVSAKRLSRLVDDLLNVSRIEGGKVAIRPEKIDVVDFLRNYFKETEILIKEKNLTFTFDNTPDKLEVVSDRNALQNIYQSLVSNAIEYTMPGGKIEVSLGKKGDSMFEFKISDTGIGIPEKDQKTIFEKFTRGENAQAVKTDGTGFGLYIAKQTAEMLGGDITLQSVENKGTTFFVDLPIISKEKEGSKGFA